MSDVLALALNPTVDLTWEVDRLEPAGKNRARQRGVAAGGGGINVVRGATALGGSATAVHTAGQAVGQRLDRLLDEEGLDHRSVAIGDATREAVVLLAAEAAQTFHIVPAGPRVSEEEWRRCLDELVDAAASTGHVVLSGSLPDGVPDRAYAEAIRRISGMSCRVVLDTSSPALRPALDEGVYLVKPNKREVASLIGRRVETFDDAREAAVQLLDRDAAEVVVITVGELGAMCATQEGQHQVRTPPLPRRAISDAGAGDSLVAAMTLRLAEGAEPVDACAAGVAAAAAAVLTPGTQLFDPEEATSLRSGVEIR